MRCMVLAVPLGLVTQFLWAVSLPVGAQTQASSPSSECVADLTAASIAQTLGKGLAESQDREYADIVPAQVERYDLDGEAVLELFGNAPYDQMLGFVSQLLPGEASLGVRLRLLSRLRSLVTRAPSIGCRATSAQPAAVMSPRTGGCGDDFPSEPATASPAPGSIASERALAAVEAEGGLQGPMHEINLRRDLLDESRYDRYVAPPNLNSNGGVQLGLNFFKVISVDLKSSVLTLSAWLRLDWVDERLKFNQTRGLEYLIIPANTGEMGQIWVPDVELYNSEEPLASTLAETSAIVRPDGYVQWSRLGILKILCKFRGLRTFPVDTLVCHLEFGAWSLAGGKQNIVLRRVDGGIQFDPKSEDGTSTTAGSTYQDYFIKDITVSRFAATYNCCPNETWPQILYEMTVGRAVAFYVMKLIIPQVSMALLSLLTYFMNPEIGERLGFGITLVLAVIATDIVASDLSPVCSETLLIDAISRFCLFFCVFALFETGLVLFLYHLEVFDFQELLPRFCRSRRSKSTKSDMIHALLRREFMERTLTENVMGMMRAASSLVLDGGTEEQGEEQTGRGEGDRSGADPDGGSDLSAPQDGDGEQEDSTCQVVDVPQMPPPLLPHGVPPGAFLVHAPYSPPAKLPVKQLHIDVPENDSDGSSVKSPPMVSPKREKSFSSVAPSRMMSTASGLSKVSKVSKISGLPAMQHGTVKTCSDSTSAADTRMDYRLRLQAYREAFYILDDDFSGLLERNEVNSFGLFMLGDDWSEEMLDQFIESADLDGSGGLSLQEFCDFCESTICDTSGTKAGPSELSFVRDMVKGFIAITHTRQQMTKAMWQSRALTIDKWCRFWVPTSFILIGLCIAVWAMYDLGREGGRS